MSKMVLRTIAVLGTVPLRRPGVLEPGPSQSPRKHVVVSAIPPAAVWLPLASVPLRGRRMSQSKGGWGEDAMASSPSSSGCELGESVAAPPVRAMWVRTPVGLGLHWPVVAAGPVVPGPAYRIAGGCGDRSRPRAVGQTGLGFTYPCFFACRSFGQRPWLRFRRTASTLLGQ